MVRKLWPKHWLRARGQHASYYRSRLAHAPAACLQVFCAICQFNAFAKQGRAHPSRTAQGCSPFFLASARIFMPRSASMGSPCAHKQQQQQQYVEMEQPCTATSGAGDA